MHNLPKIYVGVDVSKNSLEIHMYPVNKSMRVKNDESGIAKLISMLSKFKTEQIAFEASGGYERLLMQILLKSNLPAWRVEPRRIKGFIRSEGVHAKTDASDARMIALFASQKECKVTPVAISDQMWELKALVARRQDVSVMLTGEKTRLQQSYGTLANQLIQDTINFLTQQLDALDKNIKTLIKSNNEWKQKSELAQSMNGIGPVSAAILIAEMPELGLINSKSIAALAGVAPIVKQSGDYKGYSATGGGRTQVRHVLYMAALTAAFNNPIFKAFYNRLINKGKKPKVALIAIVRKMLVILNSMFKNNQAWKIA